MRRMIAALTIRPLKADDVAALTGVLGRAYQSGLRFEPRLHMTRGAAPPACRDMLYVRINLGQG